MALLRGDSLPAVTDREAAASLDAVRVFVERHQLRPLAAREYQMVALATYRTRLGTATCQARVTLDLAPDDGSWVEIVVDMRIALLQQSMPCTFNDGSSLCQFRDDTGELFIRSDDQALGGSFLVRLAPFYGEGQKQSG